MTTLCTVYIALHEPAQLPEVPQIQYDVDDATDDAPAFINLRMFFLISLDPISSHYNEGRQNNG